VQINSRYYENVTVEEVPRIVEQLRTRTRTGTGTGELEGVPADILRTVDIAENGHGGPHHGGKEVPR
jgi:hypothetical protein